MINWGKVVYEESDFRFRWLKIKFQNAFAGKRSLERRVYFH